MPMLFEEAFEIMQKTQPDTFLKNTFFRGLNILSSWDHAMQPFIKNGAIYIPNFTETLKRMNQRDVERMRLFGWSYDVDENSWIYQLEVKK